MCQSRLTHGLVQPFTRWPQQHKHKIHKTQNNFNTNKEPVLFNPLPGGLINKKQSTNTKYKNHKLILTQIQLLKTQKKSRITHDLVQPFTSWLGHINTNTKYKKTQTTFKNHNCSKYKKEPIHPRPCPSLYHVAISMQKQKHIKHKHNCS